VVLSRVNDITYIVQLTRTKQKRVVHVDKLKLWSRAAAATESDNESAPVLSAAFVVNRSYCRSFFRVVSHFSISSLFSPRYYRLVILLSVRKRELQEQWPPTAILQFIF
jgi:hypothetical protein